MRITNCTAWALLLSAGLLALSCGPAGGSEMSDSEKLAQIQEFIGQHHTKFPEVPGISAEELPSWLERDGVVLVDVREPAERQVSRLAGSLSREEFERRASELEGSTVISYCTVGYRSSVFAQSLREQGWDAHNLEGSMLAWTHAGGSLEDPEGQPTRRVHVFGKRWNLAAEGYDPVW